MRSPEQLETGSLFESVAYEFEPLRPELLKRVDHAMLPDATPAFRRNKMALHN